MPRQTVIKPDGPPTPGNWYYGSNQPPKDNAVLGRQLYDGLCWRIQNNDAPDEHAAYKDENVDIENYISAYNNMSMKLLYNLYKDWILSYITHDDLITELEYVDYEPNK
jgi:hypothetical protein